MNTTNDKSLTRAADPASVFIACTLDTSTGSVALNGLEKGGCLTAKPVYPGQESTPATEAQDGAPVASEGERLFRFMVDAAIDQGHVSNEGADHILKALYGRGR